MNAHWDSLTRASPSAFDVDISYALHAVGHHIFVIRDGRRQMNKWICWCMYIANCQHQNRHHIVTWKPSSSVILLAFHRKRIKNLSAFMFFLCSANRLSRHRYYYARVGQNERILISLRKKKSVDVMRLDMLIAWTKLWWINKWKSVAGRRRTFFFHKHKFLSTQLRWKSSIQITRI